MVHPNNPTGSFVVGEERRALNQFCRENNLALVVDEVFLDYAHDGKLRPTFANNQDVLTFHPERLIENFRAAADEVGMDRDQRSG